MSEPAKPKDEGRSIPVGLGTAVLLFGFIIQFFSVRQSLPVEIQIVSAVFAGASAFLFGVWAWYPPIARHWAERKSGESEDRISRESVGTFQSYVERLKNNCSVQRGDTIVYPLQNLKNSVEFDKLPDLNPYVYSADSLCFQLAGLFNRVEANRNTFTWAVDTFTSVLRLFSDSLTRFVNEARLMAEQKPIPRQVREDYNTNRQGYIRFLDDYTAFVEGLNKQFRSYEVTLPGGSSMREYAFRSVYAERPKEL